MHTDEDYDKSVEEDENDFSDFYNTADEEENEKKNDDGKKDKKIIFIIIGLSIVLIALIVLLILILKKGKPVDFTLSLKDINGDEWSKEKVVINIDVPNEEGLKKLKYSINCDKKCNDYVDVVDKKIEISNNGISNVTVVSVNNDGVEKSKNITVKIDNKAPEVVLSPLETDIKAVEPITVCAICTDNESGCKEQKVCHDYSATAKNQTLTVEDNAGNKTVSNKFNVTISSGGNNGSPSNVSAPSCSLSVNSSGLVSAKYSSATGYHGFSSSYSGTSETTKQVTASKNGEAIKVTYYVKNSEGKTSSCSITVKASCSCKYRGDDGKCYKTEVKTIQDPNSSDCAGATKKTNAGCAFYKNEGLSCTYSK